MTEQGRPLIISGDNNPALVEMYSPDRVRQEARRMANNCRLTGMEYTARILERLANEG